MQRRREAEARGLRAVLSTVLLLGLVLTLLAGATGCGMSASAGSLKAGVGVPVDVTGHVTPAGGEGTIVGRETGQPLVSGAFAVYWPNIFAEAVSWISHRIPDLASTLLGGGTGPPAAVAPASGAGGAVSS